MKVGSTEYTLRTMGRVGNMQEMDSITVANRDGRTITIGDLGRAEDSTEEVKSASLYNDTPCVLLNIRKQSGTNTVEVADLLKERLESLRKAVPKDYRVEVVRDQSVFIEASVDTVKEHLMLGGGLAAIVVFFFLANVRATAIAALSIPASIIAAFAIILYMGFTLNSMTLLALTLSVGIVIDDAIVVMENIFRYIEEKGYSPFEAAVAATGEIGLAVMSITLSLVAVFLPIAMMSGIVGRFLKSFGITMAATIMVSMLVSFTLTPMLAARWFKGAAEEPAKGGAGRARARRRLERPGVLSRHRKRLPGRVAILAPAALAGRVGRDRLHGHAADAAAGRSQDVHSRRRFVGVSTERPGAGRDDARSDPGARGADRPPNPPTQRRANTRLPAWPTPTSAIPTRARSTCGWSTSPSASSANWRSWTSCGRTSCRSTRATTCGSASRRCRSSPAAG